MNHVFHRHTKAQLPTVAGGDGPYLIDTEGRRYLDASGGAAVSCLGHSARPVLDAVKAQLDRIAYAHSSFFTSEPAERLADRLIAKAPPGIDRVYFLSGGSEAIEAAIKLARQYHMETRRAVAPPHRRPLAELSRQHARRAVGRRQPLAPRAVRAAALAPP